MNGINSKHQLDFTCFSQNNTHAIRMQFRMIPPVHIVSRSLIVALAALGASLTFANHAGAADSGKIVIQVDKPGARISPMFYGLMTEEINYSYDGGLYGELIQNRIFKNVPRGGRGRGPATPPQTLFASSSLDEATGDIILKVVNAVETQQQMEINVEGVPMIGKTAKMEVLTGGLTDVNSIAEPMKVAPKSSMIDASTKFVREFPGNTVTVIRFSTK